MKMYNIDRIMTFW